MIDSGTRAPDFSLPASGGGHVRLADYVGTAPVVIYFYPKDDTLGCTIESCAFRDSYEEFVKAGAAVIGISADSVSSHEAFQSKYRLPFVLASDVDGRTARAYDVTALLRGLPGRATFVVGADGIVRDAFSSHVRFKRHVTRALEVVRRLNADAKISGE